MHGQLGQTNVRCGHGYMGNGYAAQGAAAGNVRPVVVGLHLGSRLLADLAEQGGAEPVGAVALVGIEFQHHALSHHRGVCRVGQLRMVGMDGMGIVRGNQEGLAQQPADVQPQSLSDADQGVLHHGGIRAVLGAGANFFAVQGAEHPNVLAFRGSQEALEAAPNALQIVQPLRGDVFLLHAPHLCLLPDVQVQVVAQDFAAGFLLQQFIQLALGVFTPQQRIQVHHRVPLVAVVGLAVHVDGHIGDEHQIPLDVDELCFRALLRLHQHPSSNGQGPVQPGSHQGPAVALHRETRVGAHLFPVLFQLKAGPVGVGGGDQKALGGAYWNPESDYRGTAPADVVFPSGDKAPFRSFLQLGVALLL